MRTLLAIILAFSINCYSTENCDSTKDSKPTLDELAIDAGTDKSTLFHGYTKIYSRYFEAKREDPIKFLEIGIYKGESVKMWEAYFPNGQLHFIDITLANNNYLPTHSTFHLVDQSKIPALQNLMRGIGGDFDVIIDDGGHTMTQQINSFIALFPFVKSGGLYVIEDLHTSYWKDYGGGGTLSNPASVPSSCTEFLKKLIDQINFIGARTGWANYDQMPENLRKSLNIYQDHIFGMYFFGSLCIIEKR